jgi:alkyldihydroxyacetonephosphate synthase
MGAGGPAIALETLTVPPSRLDAATVQALRNLVPTGMASDQREERLLHSFGRSYVDLITIRRGYLGNVTDAVVHPASSGEVEDVLRYAAANDLAVVPWGGGTSVVGGVDPDRGSHRAVITLSLARLMDPLGFDEVSRLAKFQCGIHGPELEKYLNARGYTVGHFPQSFEFSTLGGWLATRSSGQASSRYGEIVERLRGATVVTPVGTYRWERGTSESSGPDPGALFPGSEGTLGVFVEASLAVDRQPASSSYRVALLPDWDNGVTAVRELSQEPPVPAVLRLSDPQETLLTLEGRPPAATLGERMRERLEPGILNLRKLEEGSMCLLVTGYEGSEKEVRDGEARRRDVLHRHGGFDIGARAGESWKRERFLLPYLRDDLVEDGWLVETLETGAAWSEISSLTASVRQALVSAARRAKFPLLCAAHLSHTSPTGSGLYFTIIAPQKPQDPVGQWLALKESATEALLSHGGVLSHHHGVGQMHRPWVGNYRRTLGRLSLRAAKQTLDPGDTLNPSKTLADDRKEPAKARSAAAPSSTPSSKASGTPSTAAPPPKGTPSGSTGKAAKPIEGKAPAALPAGKDASPG